MPKLRQKSDLKHWFTPNPRSAMLVVTLIGIGSLLLIQSFAAELSSTSTTVPAAATVSTQNSSVSYTGVGAVVIGIIVTTVLIRAVTRRKNR